MMYSRSSTNDCSLSAFRTSLILASAPGGINCKHPRRSQHDPHMAQEASQLSEALLAFCNGHHKR